MALVERHFAATGWRVVRNVPYAGGHTTEFHGKIATGVHAIQVEIDRNLYMEPQRLVQHKGFAEVASVITGLAQLIVAAAPVLGLAPPYAEAAE